MLTGMIKDLIEMYRLSPCLWQVTHKDYTNKTIKNVAYQSLLKFVKRFDKDATLLDVKKKIQNMRSSFRKELRKVEVSKRLGNGPDGVYTPTLWYYDLFLFTTDYEGLPLGLEGISDDEEISNNDLEEDGGTERAVKTEPEEGVRSQFYSTTFDEEGSFQSSKSNVLNSLKGSPMKVFPDTWNYGQNSPVDQLPNKRRKEEFESVGCSALSDSFPAPSNYLERSEDSKEFDAVGVNVAAKLKKMTSSQQIYAELLINKVLAKGLLNKLTEETDLSDF